VGVFLHSYVQLVELATEESMVHGLPSSQDEEPIRGTEVFLHSYVQLVELATEESMVHGSPSSHEIDLRVIGVCAHSAVH
jgi:CHASE2 domain-containing sensor protein